METLRHLVFATDAWAARAILARERALSPGWSAASGYPDDLAATIGLDCTLAPSLAEMLAVRAERMSLVAGIVAGLTEDLLARVCEQPSAPGYPEQTRTVARCCLRDHERGSGAWLPYSAAGSRVSAPGGMSGWVGADSPALDHSDLSPQAHPAAQKGGLPAGSLRQVRMAGPESDPDG